MENRKSLYTKKLLLPAAFLLSDLLNYVFSTKLQIYMPLKKNGNSEKVCIPHVIIVLFIILFHPNHIRWNPFRFRKGYGKASSKEVCFNVTGKRKSQTTHTKWPHTDCCHVIPTLGEAHVEDEVIRCLPLANKWNLPLQILANRRSPANKKPEYYQKHYCQHPHDPSTSHIWNPLGCSRKKHLQNPGKAKYQHVKQT